MKQQRLNYKIPVTYEYGLWVRHAGVEPACNRIALWLVQGGVLWLASEEMAGKTHFLHAIEQEHPHVGLVAVDEQQVPAVSLVQNWLEKLESHAYWIVDLAAGPASGSQGLALFHLIERAREMNRPLLISWRCDEAGLAPPELSSRMRMMERAAMAAPKTDHDLRAVMHSVAEGLQWQVKESLLSLMLTQLPRSLPEQIAALTQLESASLEERQRITQAWAKEKLNLDSVSS
jgi:chromosomal replication initiation ATPase DnaA